MIRFMDRWMGMCGQKSRCGAQHVEGQKVV